MKALFLIITGCSFINLETTSRKGYIQDRFVTVNDVKVHKYSKETIELMTLFKQNDKILLAQKLSEYNPLDYKEVNILLHKAVTSKAENTLKLLIGIGYDTEYKDEDGNTPLMKAEMLGYVEIAKILSENKEKIKGIRKKLKKITI